MRAVRRWRLIIALLAVPVSCGSPTLGAHRDPCHRQHACPSDQGT
jgi:hypothetical protein